MGAIPKEAILESRDGIMGRMETVPDVPKNYGARLVEKAKELGYMPIVRKKSGEGLPTVVDIYERSAKGGREGCAIIRGAAAEDGGWGFDVMISDDRGDFNKIYQDFDAMTKNPNGGR
jgi:hypothetical protein